VKAKCGVLVAGGVMAVSVMASASAGAATVTIGSPLTSTFTNNPAGSVATNAMVTGPNLASPVDGTVVNWRTQNFVGTLRFRVLKLDAGLAATAVASSQPISLSGGTVDTPLNVPIHKGEIVGFDNTSGSDRADIAAPSPTYTSAFWTTLPDNASPQAPANADPIEFAYNATVRYCLVPNVVGKKVGAAGQALSEAGCTLGTVTKKKAKKKKLKGPKIVKSQSAPPGTSLGDQAPVDVHVKVKPKKKKKKS
jgi:hypothetical protein